MELPIIKRIHGNLKRGFWIEQLSGLARLRHNGLQASFKPALALPCASLLCSGLFGNQAGDSEMTVVVGCGDGQAIGGKIHIPEDIGQAQAMNFFIAIGLEKEQESARASA